MKSQQIQEIYATALEALGKLNDLRHVERDQEELETVRRFLRLPLKGIWGQRQQDVVMTLGDLL